MYCEAFNHGGSSWVAAFIEISGLALGAKLFRRHFPLCIGTVGAVLIGRFV